MKVRSKPAVFRPRNPFHKELRKLGHQVVKDKRKYDRKRVKK